MLKFVMISLAIASMCGSAAQAATPPKGGSIQVKGFFCGTPVAAKAAAKIFNTGNPTVEDTVAAIEKQNIPCALGQGRAEYEGQVDSLIIDSVNYSIDALQVGTDTYYTFRVMDGQAI